MKARFGALAFAVVLLGALGLLGACSSSSHSSGSPLSSSTSSSAPSSSSTAVAASGSDVGGTWTGTWQRTQPVPGQGAVTLDLATTANGIKGSVSWTGSACLGHADIEGALNGSAITYHTVGGSATATFEGTVNGSSMSGTANVSCGAGNGVGTWKVTKQ